MGAPQDVERLWVKERLQKRKVIMRKEESGAEMLLDSDRLADEKRLEAVLSDWGVERTAIARILKEHRARQFREQNLQSALALTCPLVATSANYINQTGPRPA